MKMAEQQCPTCHEQGMEEGVLKRTPSSRQKTDFSVVLFRLDFMLASEEDPMKAHKNQWLLTMPSPPAIPCGAMNQGTHHGVWRADAFAVT
jgi:hypothetical protein